MMRQPQRFVPGDADLAAHGGARRQHQRAGDEKSHGAHHRGRKMLLVGDSDGQIRRAPEDVHQGEGDDHLQTVVAVDGHGKRLQLNGAKERPDALRPTRAPFADDVR